MGRSRIPVLFECRRSPRNESEWTRSGSDEHDEREAEAGAEEAPVHQAGVGGPRYRARAHRNRQRFRAGAAFRQETCLIKSTGPLPHLTRASDSNYITPDGICSTARAVPVSGIDEVGLCEHLLTAFPSDVGRTPVRGVRRVVPDFGGPTPFDSSISDEDLAAAMWSAVRRAVEQSIVGADRVAVSLGGTDSSGLLAALCELVPASEVVAYTCDYDRGADVPFARELCAAYGVEFRVIEFAGALPHVPSALVIDGLPYWSIGGAHELHLQTVLARDGVDRLLTGVYGDDILGGEASMLGARLLAHPVQTLLHLKHLRTPYPSDLAARLRSSIIGPLGRRALPRDVHDARVRRNFRRRAPWLLQQVFRHGRLGMMVSARGFLPPLDVMEWRAELARRVTCSWGPRAQTVVQGGVSRADPYVSNEFVRFALAVPFERLSLGDVHRGLFRRALPRRVPDSVRARQSKGFTTDDFPRLARAADATLRPLATVDRLESTGLVNGSRFREAFETLGASHPIVWAVLGAEAFLREVS